MSKFLLKNKVYILFFLVYFFAFGCQQKQQGTEAKKIKNIVLITLDGFRWRELFQGADKSLIANTKYVRDTQLLKKRFWAEDKKKRRELLMPFFWSVIAKEGQLYGNRMHQNFVNVSNSQHFSYPGYSEILCGFVDTTIVSNDKINNKNKTVLEFLNEQPKLAGRVAAFSSWDVFPYIINEERSGVLVNAGNEKRQGEEITEREDLLNQLVEDMKVYSDHSTRLDAFTHHYAFEYLKEKKPRTRILYIAYDETDRFAHSGEYDKYLEAAHQIDQFIAELWELTQSKLLYRNKTVFIITTDHGRGEGDQWTSHYKDVEHSDETWIALLGVPSATTKGEQKVPAQYYQNQIAKTCASLLGIDYKNSQPVGDAIPIIKKNK